MDKLREWGCSVQDLSRVGHGCPDLAVGLRGQNFFLEVKDGTRKPSAIRLNDQQEKWRQLWSGQVDVVYSIEDALRVVGLL